MLKPSTILIALAFCLATPTDSEGQPKRTSRANPPAATRAQAPGQEQRGTDQYPLSVKILPGQDSKEKTDKEEKERQEKADIDKELANQTKRLADYTLFLSIFTVLLFVAASVQVGFFWYQLRLMRSEAKKARINLIVAKRAANAATINAQAVMDGEGAHIYPIIKCDNLRNEVFFGIVDYKTSQKTDIVSIPNVTFSFKNYGKTPAVLNSFMYGITFFEEPSRERTMYLEPRPLIDILAAGDETPDITVQMFGSVTRGNIKSIREDHGQLLFFGEASFRDFFNRNLRCIWECDGRGDGFRLIRHEEREDPKND